MEYNIKIKHTKQNDFFSFEAFNDKDEKLGFINFKILDNNTIWLYQIATYEKYRNHGVGEKLLKDMEKFTLLNTNCSHIIGKFNPMSPYAEQFYINNGYEINEINYSYVVEKTLIKNKNLNVTDDHTHGC